MEFDIEHEHYQEFSIGTHLVVIDTLSNRSRRVDDFTLFSHLLSAHSVGAIDDVF